MPLTRYQIRNEYSLADPELYRAADKDDPEALLEGVAMAGLVGVLRQLGDLTQFAAEIFHDLHEEVMATTARGHCLMLRVQQLEAEVPSIEKAFLSQTSHSKFLLNAGVVWHPNLRMDEDMITRKDLPRCVMDSYEECRGPPRLFLLDKFDVAGAGACLKRYSDPSFFKAEFTSSSTMGADIHRERKARKVKKKGSRWSNGENPEVYTTSHVKLHHLLSEERNVDNNVLIHHVKLKKRQLNGFLPESTTGKSYMERFVETNSPQSKISYENSLVLTQLNVESNNTSERGPEIREIGTTSPAAELMPRERELHLSAERQETALEQSVYELHEDVIKEDILEKVHLPTCDIGVEKVPSSLCELEDKRELIFDVESQKEVNVDGYQSDDVTSGVDNYMDALATVEYEFETDTDSRPHDDQGFLNTKRLGRDSEIKEQQKLQDRFSDPDSIDDFSESDDLLKKGRHNLSNMDTLSNLAVKGPPSHDAVAEVATPAGTCPNETVDVSSEKPSANDHTLVTESLEYVGPSGSGIEVSEMPTSGSELVEPSPDSCVTYSTSAPVSPAANLNGFQLQGPDFVGYESPSSSTEDTENLDVDVPCTSNLFDSVTKMKDDVLAEEFVKSQQMEVMDGFAHDLSSEALLNQSDLSGLVVARKDDGSNPYSAFPTKCAEGAPAENINGNNDSPNAVTLPAEEQLSRLEGQHIEICSSTMRPECLPANTNSDDLDDLKSDRTLETDTGIQTTRENPEYLTSALDIQKTRDFAKQDLLEMPEMILPQMDLGLGSGSSGVKALCNNLEVSSNMPDDGGVLVGKDTAASPEFPSLHLASDSTITVSVVDHHLQMDSLSDTVHADADADGVMYSQLIGSSNCSKLQEDYPQGSRDLGSLASEVNAHLDNMESVGVHGEAVDEDTSICQRIICSMSRNHVKLEDECPASNGTVSDIENGVHLKLDNLTAGAAHTEAGAAHTEAGDADTADCPNLIGSSWKIQMRLQEECLGDSGSEECRLETVGVQNRKFIIGEDTQKEKNQLAAASKDLNVVVYNSEPHGPSISELPHEVHVSLPVQHAESHLHPWDITGVPKSFVEVDKELLFAHPSLPSQSSEDPMCTLSNQELWIPSEQSRVLEGQLIAESLHGDRARLSDHWEEQTESLRGRDHSPSVPSEISWVGKTEPVKHSDLEASSGAGAEFSASDPLKQPLEPDFPPLPTGHNMVTCEPAIDPWTSSFPSFDMLSGTTHELSLKLQPSQGPDTAQADLEAPSLPPLPPLQWRVGKFQPSSLTVEGEVVQPNLNPFLPLISTPLGGEIVQPLNPTEGGKHQNGSKASGGDMVHSDLNPFSSELPAVVGDAYNKQGSQPSEIEETQLPNLFLPLPAAEVENHEHDFLPSGEEKVQPTLNSSAPSQAIEEVRPASDTLQGESHDLQSLLEPESNMNHGPIKDEETLDSFVPIIKDEENLYSFAPPTIKEDEPLNSFEPPTIKHEELACNSSTLGVEMASNVSTSFSDAEVGVPNGKPPKKQPRPRDPLIEAVASHDRSTLRKATERVRPQIAQNIDERDSLLEQIRSKSFNLKPAVRPMLTARPSIQGPRTNLKVAAILEKANAIRQATAGSDEDDSWSDS